jgi:regulatory protein
LERRLLQAGFDHAEIQEALDGLSSVGLIDDRRFAERFVERAGTGKLDGRKRLMSELLAKGVARDVAEGALAEVEGSEEARACELAERQAPRLSRLEPDAARRRLYGFLLRRGFDHASATVAVRKTFGDS